MIGLVRLRRQWRRLDASCDHRALFALAYKPRQRDGVAAAAPIAHDPGCGCWKYSGKPYGV